MEKEKVTLTPAVAAKYKTTLPDDGAAHIFFGVAGRKRLDQLNIAQIDKMQAAGKHLDVFIPISEPKTLRPEADVIADIKAVKSSDGVDALIIGDNRAQVLSAADKKKKDLAGA